MDTYPEEREYTEPVHVDVNTLKNLGPLSGMAGIWEGECGRDTNPDAASPTSQETYVEHIELQPIDPQTNGSQLFYGMRYHTHAVKPGHLESYHDQVGYWLWEPATNTIIHTLTIPRGQTVLAGGKANVDADSFELSASHGSDTFGICSAPFLEHAFKTNEFHIKVNIGSDGTWSYESDTVMLMHGKPEPFHHRDRNTLQRIAYPTPNPLAR